MQTICTRFIQDDLREDLQRKLIEIAKKFHKRLSQRRCVERDAKHLNALREGLKVLDLHYCHQRNRRLAEKFEGEEFVGESKRGVS